jgi:hypothetical protein
MFDTNGKVLSQGILKNIKIHPIAIQKLLPKLKFSKRQGHKVKRNGIETFLNQDTAAG